MGACGVTMAGVEALAADRKYRVSIYGSTSDMYEWHSSICIVLS